MHPEPVEGASRARLGMMIVMIPAGAILGFLGGLVIEIIIGLIAGAAFSADHPPSFSWRFLGSLPGLGALVGAVLAPILYARSRHRDLQPEGTPKPPGDSSV